MEMYTVFGRLQLYWYAHPEHEQLGGSITLTFLPQYR